MTIEANETKFKAFLNRLEEHHGAQELKATSEPDHADRAVQELLFSFFLWESSHVKAEQAMRHVAEAVVDYNELRICMLDDLIELLPSRYPRAEERSLRLLATLNDLFRREHGVSLVRVAALPKREAKSYLLSLDGIPHFVASRVALLCSGAHAFPLDERLCSVLVGESILPANTSVDSAISWAERVIRAGDALQAYTLLEAHAQTIALQSRDKAQPSLKKQTKTTRKPSKKTSTSSDVASKQTKTTSGSEKNDSLSRRKKSG